MKSILIFINTLGGGGAEKVLLNFLKKINYEKYKIILVSVIGGIYENEIPKQVKYKKIIKSNSFFGLFISKILFHIPSKLFQRLFLHYAVDLKIAYLEGFPTKVISTDASSKKIAFVHCDVSSINPLSHLYTSKSCCIRDYNKFDKVCFVSQKALEGFTSMYGKLNKACVIHNIVDVDDIILKSYNTIPESYCTKGLKLISVGRLSFEKGFDRLIKVLAILEKKYEFELWIIGDGNQKEELEKLIKSLQVKSVKLMGFKTNPYPYIKMADFVICSSYYEGYSTAANESLLLGVPILTTECAGMDEITENGKYGLIVKNSEEGLLKGLEMIMYNDRIVNQYRLLLKEREQLTRLNEYENMLDELL